MEDTLFQELKIELSEGIYITYHCRPLQDSMDAMLWQNLSAEEQEAFSQLRAEKRKIEWCEARRARSMLKVPMNYRVIHQSLSHSWYGDQGVAAATFLVAAPGISSSYCGVGIDLEHHAREISESVRLWLSESSIEPVLGFEPLQLWSIKEACFKADPFQSATDTIRNYGIESSTGKASGFAKKKNTETQFHFYLYSWGQWLVTVATASVPPLAQ
ncbi:MAG: hypothetical protein KDD33_09235 [Bdellovibrionales bacterium]|nr:hypothetical protein [Bdellovibrionales bacterium]